MKEIKDKKIYKTVTMVGSRPTYIDVFNLLIRWEGWATTASTRCQKRKKK